MEIFILTLLSFLAFVFYVKKPATANLPPGPPRLPIIGNLHQLSNMPHLSFSALSKKYGPVMLLKLGQVPTLVVSSPEMAKEVLKTYDPNCCSRPFSHGANRLSYNSMDLAFGPYNDHWRETRKLCMMKLFSVKRVQSRDHIKAILFDMYIGAISTSSVTVGWAMAELARNPTVMTKVQVEIRSSIGCKPLVVESEIEKLKYLKMVVKETFRLTTSPLPLMLSATNAFAAVALPPTVVASDCLDHWPSPL